MIKGKMTGLGGREVVLVGLTHANLEQLKREGLDGFKRIDGAQFGLPFDILITAGASGVEMMDGLASLAGPGTEIIDDEGSTGAGGGC